MTENPIDPKPDQVRWDCLLAGCTLATLDCPTGYGVIEDAALGWRDGILTFVGTRSQLAVPSKLSPRDRGEGSWGTRAWSMYTIGFSGNGRGIQQRCGAAATKMHAAVAECFSVRASANPSMTCCRHSCPVQVRSRRGGHAEIKSGYGLDYANERKMLRVARRLGMELGITVRTTFLGAHALPPEFNGRADDYIDAVCDWLPRLHEEGLVDAVDAFCERIGFTLAQTRRVFVLPFAGSAVKLHADS